MKKYCESIPTHANLNLVVALACEARPLIQFFSLKKIELKNHFQLYANKEKNIHLIVSGIGKIRAAAATAFLFVYSGQCENTIFLNIGIAGGHAHSIGDLLLIHKITDQASNYRYYPSGTFLFSSQQQAAIITRDQPQKNYPQQGLVDMEASGFFQAASQLVYQEQIFVFKIISDNDQAAIHQIKPRMVENLIEGILIEFQAIAKNLLQFSASLHTVDFHQDFISFYQRWHFSTYQRHQLQEILRRWRVLKPDQEPMVICQHESSSHMVLAKLTQHLDEIIYTW